MTDCNLYKISPKESNQCNQCSVSSHQNQKLLIEQMTSAHNLLMCDAILKDWEWKWNIKIFHTYIYAFDKHVSCFMFLMYFPVLTETSDPERSDTSGTRRANSEPRKPYYAMDDSERLNSGAS